MKNSLIASKLALGAALSVQAKDKTVQGSSLTVNTMGGVKVDHATVTAVDIAADNGVIHVIDNVVMPM